MFTVAAMVSILGGLVNLYSPDLGTGTLYLGGWRVTGQTEDRIYALVNGRVTERLRRPGWHVNDPSIVQVPDGSGWRMYYTGLSAADNPGHMNERNVLGTAFSPDGDLWVDEGILLSQWNGKDLGGVWSPGALVVGDEVWVYANSNAPIYRDYRIRMGADGRTLLGTDVLSLDVVPGYYPFLSNLDVAAKVDAPGYWMVANTADGRRIHLYESEDGLVWRWVQKLVSNTATRTWTPHLANVTAGGFDVLFGWTEVPGEWRTRSLHRWTWTRIGGAPR